MDYRATMNEWVDDVTIAKQQGRDAERNDILAYLWQELGVGYPSVLQIMKDIEARKHFGAAELTPRWRDRAPLTLQEYVELQNKRKHRRISK